MSDMATPAASAATTLRSAKRALRKSMATALQAISREQVLKESEQIAERILRSPTYTQARSLSIYVNMLSGEVDTNALCRAALKDGKRLYVPLFAAPSPAAPLPSAAPTGSSTSRAAPVSTPEHHNVAGAGGDSAPAPNTSATGEKPKVTFASDMRMLRLVDTADHENMKENRWGIREPDVRLEDGSVREDALDDTTGGDGLDLVLVPGVAFDSQGGRLGHGKGYYDRYITRADEWASARGRPGPVTVALALRAQMLPPPELVPTDADDRVLDAILSADTTIEGRGRWVSS